MFIEFQAPEDDRWPPEYVNVARVLRCIYYGVIAGAFCANMLVVAHTTALSVLGASLALRGPDGSMMTATDGLYEERKSVFNVFGYGLACTLGSVVLCVWIILHWEAALACMIITLITIRKVYENYHRVTRRFDFDENDTVDFKDIFEGAANIHTYRVEPGRHHHQGRQYQHHHNNNHRHQKDAHSNNRSHRARKHHSSGNSTNDRNRHHPYDNSPRYSPNTSDDEEQMELVIPSNSPFNMNQRSGIQQRRGYGGNSSTADSLEEGSHGGDSNYIQTV